MTPPAAPLFYGLAEEDWQRRQRRAQAFRAENPEHLATDREAVAFLNYIFTPADGRWAFRPNGKTGTTSALYFLFHLVTGHPLSARLQISDSMNPDQAAHELHRAQVFCFLLAQKINPTTYLRKTLRLTTVRDPLARAVSGFRYLCRSDAAGMAQFYPERARLCALTGFDWDRHPNTPDGFVRFLDYLRLELAHQTERPVDSHFRPQVLNILPGLFRPELVGRCEDLPTFFAEIAERLELPLPEGALEAAPRNRAQDDVVAETLITPAARRLVTEIFAPDYEAFGYIPAA